MREILGRRRLTPSWSLRCAALRYAAQWQWPLLPGTTVQTRLPSGRPDTGLRHLPWPAPSGAIPPGATPSGATPSGATPSGASSSGAASPGAASSGGTASSAVGPSAADSCGAGRSCGAEPVTEPAMVAEVLECSCRDQECVVPGAHPLDPPLLAATTDARMLRWWWTNRPRASVLLATGGRAPSAVSLPAVAGPPALAELDRRGVRTGPVAATATRFTLLVRPYSMEELGDLLFAMESVPSSLRFHGEGGYIALPPSQTGAGEVRWERPPVADGHSGLWLPEVRSLLDVLVAASAAAPDTDSRLAY